MTQNTSDAGNSTPAQRAMKQSSKIEDQTDDTDQGSVKQPEPAQGVSKGDKPVGESDNNGSSPYEKPNHLVKRQRQGE